jgi:hypothetical protein
VIAWRHGWRKIAAVLAGVSVVWTLLVVGFILTETGNGPLGQSSCTVELSGTTVAMTFSSSDASARCSRALAGWHKSGLKSYLADQQPGEPVVCHVSDKYTAVTVEAVGDPVDAQALCAALEKEASKVG